LIKQVTSRIHVGLFLREKKKNSIRSCKLKYTWNSTNQYLNWGINEVLKWRRRFIAASIVRDQVPVDLARIRLQVLEALLKLVQYEQRVDIEALVLWHQRRRNIHELQRIYNSLEMFGLTKTPALIQTIIK
jgi:hypothetical protein